MNLQQRITQSIARLNDPDTLLTAEKELKALIINEVDDGEKLQILINCIADDRESVAKGKKGKQPQLKLLIAIAETFQHQIIEFLPKIFGVLNKRIKEGELEYAESVADSYGGIFEFSFKGTEEAEALSVFTEALKPLFDFMEKGFKNTQIIASMCLTKIIQNSQLSLLTSEFEGIYGHVMRCLQSPNCKAPFTFLENILSLVLSIQEKAEVASSNLPPILLKFLTDEDPKVRKICIDIFYSLLVIDQQSILKAVPNLNEVLQACRVDKAKNVREAAIECLKLFGNKPVEEKKKQKESPKELKPEQPKKAHKKIAVINQKINLDHVQPTIKRAELHGNFVKQNIDAMPMVLFKEPKVKIDYSIPEPKPKEAPKKFEIEQPRGKIEEEKPNLFAIESTVSDHPKAMPNLDSNRNMKGDIEITGHGKMGDFDTFQAQKDNNIQTDDVATLKKYIKILNGKVKELQQVVLNVQRSNTFLFSKLDLLEKSFQNFSQLNDSYSYPQAIQNPPNFQNRMNFNPSFEQNSKQFRNFQNFNIEEQPKTTSKWLNKSSSSDNINETLFELLSPKNNDEIEANLILFLRVSKNMNNFEKIENTLIDKLLDKLFFIANKYASQDFIIIEYVMKWLELYLNKGKLREVDMAKKLHSLLLYLMSNLEDEDLKRKAIVLSQHNAFQQFYEKPMLSMGNMIPHEPLKNAPSNQKPNYLTYSAELDMKRKTNEIADHHFTDEKEELHNLSKELDM